METPQRGIIYTRQEIIYKADGRLKAHRPVKVKFIGQWSDRRTHCFKRVTGKAKFFNCEVDDFPLFNDPTPKPNKPSMIIYKPHES